MGQMRFLRGGGRGWPSREPKRLRDAIKTDPGVPKGALWNYGTKGIQRMGPQGTEGPNDPKDLQGNPNWGSPKDTS